jgi:hypothetical protein
MDDSALVGSVLAAGLATFLVGAVRWRLDYQRPLEESLPRIHLDRRRWTWIHVWMVAGTLVTFAGLAGLTAIQDESTARVLTAMATAVYVTGGVCWVSSLAFRLTVTSWAAEQSVTTGGIPAGFVAYDRWSGALYCVHMLSAYVASAALGVAVLASDELPSGLGWAGIGGGLVFAAGLVATRFAGPFNPPFWAHLYTATVGVFLLLD